MTLYRSILKEIENLEKTGLTEKFIKTSATNSEFQVICQKLESEAKSPYKILGLGTSCITLISENSQQVVKICSTKIKYFKYKNTNVDTFVNHSKSLQPHAVPVNEVIHRGKSFFVYTQDVCQPITKKTGLNRGQIDDLFKIVKILFKNGLHVGQLKPKNVGLKDGRLVLFDYHSMHRLGARIKDKADWSHSLVESIEKYAKHYGKNASIVAFIKYLQSDHSKFNIQRAIELLEAIQINV